MPEMREAEPALAMQHHMGQPVDGALNASHGSASGAFRGNSPRGDSIISTETLTRRSLGNPTLRSGFQGVSTDTMVRHTSDPPASQARYTHSLSARAAPSAAVRWQDGAWCSVRGGSLGAAPGQALTGQRGALAAPQQRLPVQHQQPGGCRAQAGVRPRMSAPVAMRPGAYPSTGSYAQGSTSVPASPRLTISWNR